VRCALSQPGALRPQPRRLSLSFVATPCIPSLSYRSQSSPNRPLQLQPLGDTSLLFRYLRHLSSKTLNGSLLDPSCQAWPLPAWRRKPSPHVTLGRCNGSCDFTVTYRQQLPYPAKTLWNYGLAKNKSLFRRKSFSKFSNGSLVCVGGKTWVDGSWSLLAVQARCSETTGSSRRLCGCGLTNASIGRSPVASANS
jgi:hypothetical protein